MKHGAESSQDDIVFTPLIEYDSGDSEFLRGAEVGYLEAKIELLGSVTVREMMRRSNEEMVRRLTSASGRTFRIEAVDDEWMSVTIDPRPSNGAPSRTDSTKSPR